MQKMDEPQGRTHIGEDEIYVHLGQLQIPTKELLDMVKNLSGKLVNLLAEHNQLLKASAE